MSLNGTSESLRGYNTLIKNGELPNADYLKAVLPPLGAVIDWMKTFFAADSGTTDGTSASHLVQSGQNFLTTIQVGMIVRNTTDSTFSYVTAVNSDTDLTLNDDIMVSGEAYTIYATPYLPDGWAELNGQTISDADSPYNGATLPDVNGSNLFIRGGDTSGTTDTLPTHNHVVGVLGIGGGNSYVYASDGTSQQLTLSTATSTTGGAGRVWAVSSSITAYTKNNDAAAIPPYYEMVKIMRIK